MVKIKLQDGFEVENYGLKYKVSHYGLYDIWEIEILINDNLLALIKLDEYNFEEIQKVLIKHGIVVGKAVN